MEWDDLRDKYERAIRQRAYETRTLDVLGEQAEPPKLSETELQGMLFSRMRWKRHPFDRLLACKLNDSTVVVFLIKDGKALMIEDDINLYPTDALVTQLRLLSETK